MPKLNEDGLELDIPAGATVLQSCERAGREIPRHRVDLALVDAAEMLEVAQ